MDEPLVEMVGGATSEEVAAELSRVEGRVVSVAEVRRIESQALRKLRRMLAEKGLTAGNLLPE
ncbi:MAG: hypothetical protein K0B16_08475 [Burkholderiaceae bacterium]|nr:hypothetical protein [Burkholderiaceae bacterium]